MGVYVSFDTKETSTDELKAVRSFIDQLIRGEGPAEAPTPPDEATATKAADGAVSVSFSDEPKVTTEAVNDAPPAPTRRKPGPKPKPKPEPEPEPKPEADEAEADEDDVMGESGGYSLDDAKSKAKELVGEGRTADVRKALQAVGCSRVSELSAGQVDTFMKALG